MDRRTTTIAISLSLTVAFALLALLLPVPYIIEKPGPVFDTLGRVGPSGPPVVQVSGARTYTSGGHILLTTVEDVPGNCTDHPTLSAALSAWFNADQSVVPQQAICPPGQSSAQVVEADQAEMTTSQSNAEIAALRALGYRMTGRRVIVAGVEPGSPAAAVLRPRDAIVSIDGAAIRNPRQVVSAVRDRPVGTSLRFVVRRNGRLRRVTVTSAPSPVKLGNRAKGTPYIGITAASQPVFRGVSVNIGINPLQVGGPSAGTALALGIVDKLTPGGITGGRTIAGTGTISASGRIGIIGGIQQKVAAAVQAGASVFFSPAGNCADARAAAPPSLTLVKATTLTELIAALKTIRDGGSDFPRC